MKKHINIIQSVLSERISLKLCLPTNRQHMIDKLVHESPIKTNEEDISKIVDHMYIPIYQYFSYVMQESRSQRPLIIGFSAPQGAGKTTLTSALQYLFQLDHINCEVLSLDDFYLTAEEQSNIALEHSANPLLQFRGNAGTHDLTLLQQTLHDLLNIHKQSSSSSSPTCTPPAINSPIYIPRYDKSLNSGRGDRAPRQEWSVVREKVDIVLLEGWMLGFHALPEDEHNKLNDNIKDINSYLQKYKTIYDFVNAWVTIDAEDISFVYEWRQEQEDSMASSGRSSLSPNQVRDFVDRFMPAYETYLPGLRLNGPGCVFESRSEGSLCPVLQVVTSVVSL